jgi:hypothetical protein
MVGKVQEIIGKQVSDLCSSSVPLRYADGKWRESKYFFDYYLLDGAEQSVQASCPPRECLSCDTSECDLANTERICKPRTFSDVYDEVKVQRQRLIDRSSDVPLRGKGQTVKEQQARLRYYLYPENGWHKTLPGVEHFLSMPECELHQFLIGVFGEHLIGSIVHL